MTDTQTIAEMLQSTHETLTRQQIAERLHWPLCRVCVALDHRPDDSGIEHVHADY